MGLVTMGLFASARAISAQDDASLERRLREHVEHLASDELEGRGTGEAGIRRAEAYIADTFDEAGLRPLPGHDDFFLPYELYDRGAVDPEGTRLVVHTPSGAVEGTAGDDFRPFPFSDEGSVEGDVVFAGYGITSEEHDYDDYAGIDVEDKIVLVLRHEPREDDAWSPFDGTEHSRHALFATKAANAAVHGARGMILVTDPLHHTEADDFRLTGRLSLSPERTEERAPETTEAATADTAAAVDPAEGGETPRDPSAGTSDDPAEHESPFLAVHVSLELASRMMAAQGRDLTQLQREIDSDLMARSFPIRGVRVRIDVQRAPNAVPIEARNVAGFLEGSDPGLADEWIVIGAHHDHLGVFQGEGDTVFNGADDNASGTAGVLELARTFASGPRPARSLVFVTFSGEERGLLGSRALVDQESFPIERVRFMLNLDMIGMNEGYPITVYGDGFARGLRETLERVNAELALPLEFAGTSYSGNSDHDAFYRRDIPFVFLFSGLHDHYHQLSDHAANLSYSRIARIVRLGSGICRAVADAPAPFAFIHRIGWLGASVEVMSGDGQPGGQTSGQPSAQPSAQPGGQPTAQVTAVETGSRAASYGLQVGDRIVGFDDQPLLDAHRVGQHFRDVLPGDAISMTVERDDRTQRLALERARTGYLGIWPRGIEEDVRNRHGLGADDGVLVQQVVTDGPGDQAGLESGDIVIQIGGYPVGPDNLRSRLAQIGAGETVDLTVIRDGERRVIPVTLGERPERG